MAWSLDWFAASAAARAGTKVRRVAWTDRWLVLYHGLWWIVAGSSEPRVVKSTDVTDDDLLARDWTTEEFTADVCGALPAYNTAAPMYGKWTEEPIFTPPPIPGFPDEEGD